MKDKHTLILRITATGVAAFALICGVAFASHMTSHHRQQRQEAVTAKADFHVLARAASGTVGLPPQAAQILASPALARWAPSVSKSREVATAAGTAHIVPGTGSLCFQARNAAATIGGITCGTLADANSGDDVFVGGRAATGEAFVSGLAPNGVPDVTLHFASGATQTVTVANNVYMVTVSSIPRSVSFTDSYGPESVQIGY